MALALMMRFMAGVQRWTRRPGLGRLRSLYSPPQIRRILERERARSDRTGLEFSLIRFTPRDPELAADTQRRLAAMLKSRLRCIDEIGWHDEERIVAVLPYTPATGAWTVADDICLRFGDELPPLCEVFTYPGTPWLDRGSDTPLLEEAKDGDEPDEGDGGRPVFPLEKLFCAPLPWWKRAIDVAVAAAALVLLAPLLALLALTVRLTSPGPILYKQYRRGLGGKRFLMLKFRSMEVNAEHQQKALRDQSHQDGPAFKVRNDPRVTRVGRVLRALSLDELPQLWNVLRGDMSLVGPRPLPCHESDAAHSWQQRRLDVTPGLTCIWQVYGRSRVTFDEWMRMDIRYVRSRSLLRDAWLLACTIPAVLSGRGAH